MAARVVQTCAIQSTCVKLLPVSRPRGQPSRHLKVPTMSEKVRQSKITEFIARKKSRPEFTPLVDKLIDRAHVEPLHLKNNAWELFFKGLL